MVHLYPHQREAVGKLRSGAILCGGVGSGKSITALTYYYEACGGKIDGEQSPMTAPKNLYIITTARKRDTKEWEAECKPFGLSSRVTVDSWNNIRKYVDISGAFFLFDEQRVVGNGVWVKSFLRIARQNSWLLLSATPGDTWMDYIPVFIANGYYRNRTDFLRQHVVFSRFSKYPKVDRYLETGKLIALRNRTLVNMKFERKTESHHIDVIAEWDKTECRNVMKDRWDIYKDQPIQDAAGLCYVLRRIVNSDLSRIRSVLDILTEHPKAILFYNFNYELDALREMCRKNDIMAAEWNGHKHEPIPNGDRWLYMVQYTAGAEGWNCTETDTVIFFSLNYSYKVMIQSAGRIDRLNTPFHDLYYYHIRSNAPIDIAIRKAIREKRNFNESMFLYG